MPCKATPESSTCGTSPPLTLYYTSPSSPHYTWIHNPLYSTSEADHPGDDTCSIDSEQLKPRRLFSSTISQPDPLAGLNLKVDALSSMPNDAIETNFTTPDDEDSKELRENFLDLYELIGLSNLDPSSPTSQPKPLVVKSPLQDSQPNPLVPAGMPPRSQALPRLARYKIEAISLVVPALSRTDAESRREVIGFMADHLHAG